MSVFQCDLVGQGECQLVCDKLLMGKGTSCIDCQREWICSVSNKLFEECSTPCRPPDQWLQSALNNAPSEQVRDQGYHPLCNIPPPGVHTSPAVLLFPGRAHAELAHRPHTIIQEIRCPRVYDCGNNKARHLPPLAVLCGAHGNRWHNASVCQFQSILLLPVSRAEPVWHAAGCTSLKL